MMRAVAFWKRYEFADVGALSKLPVAQATGIALCHGGKIAFLIAS